MSLGSISVTPNDTTILSFLHCIPDINSINSL